MGSPLVMHIDEAPWDFGGPDQPDKFGDQLIGDRKKGPFVLVVSLPPGYYIAPHNHDAAQVRYVLEGTMDMDGQTYGPGTVYYSEGGTDYTFTAGPEGLRYLACFAGPTGYE